MAIALSLLRSSLLLLPSSEEQLASLSNLKLGDEDHQLDEEVQILESATATLRAVCYAWLKKDLSTADYISQAQKSDIPIIPFKHKTELLRVLEGEEPAANTAPEPIAPPQPELPAYLNDAEDVLLHDGLLQGEKLVDFAYLRKDAQLKIINVLKGKSRGKVEKPGPASKQKGAPVILLSPASSALIQMSNIKTFLENGVFQPPEVAHSRGSNLVFVRKTLPTLGDQKFLVVNLTDFFTKPDYWERVVAIFTSGQQWQFKNYQEKNPEVLFQKYKGYHVTYEGDVVNKNIDKWNVETIRLDRNRRFNDKEISEQFWASLERAMIYRGYKKE